MSQKTITDLTWVDDPIVLEIDDDGKVVINLDPELLSEVSTVFWCSGDHVNNAQKPKANIKKSKKTQQKVTNLTWVDDPMLLEVDDDGKVIINLEPELPINE